MAETFEPLSNDLILRAARAGRYLPEYNRAKGGRDFFSVCRDPELASTITLQPILRYANLIDAAIIFSDILVIPQAMGMTVEMLEAKGPHFPNPLRKPEDLAQLKPEVDVRAELAYVFDAIRLTRRKLAGRVPLIGFVGAPFVKTWIFKHPSATHSLLARITDVCVDSLAHQVLAGAQMLQVFDSWAGELSPHDFRTFSLPYLRRISARVPARVRELGGEPVPMTVFAKGAWYALDELCESGYQVVGLDWTHDPESAVAVANGRVTLQGNMDPNVLYGGREAITRAVERIAKGFGGGRKGWIVNLGHGITPLVDPEDLKWFFQETRRVTGPSQ